MNPRHADIDEKQLETLFEQARRYPLLNAEQERATDTMKWEAVHSIRKMLLSRAAGRRLALVVASNILDNPPEIERIAQRDQYFVLRRELSHFTTRGKNREQLQAFVALLHVPAERGQLQAAAAELAWSASLWVGLANLLSRLAGRSNPCVVADALSSWQNSWPAKTSLRIARERDLDDLNAALGRFNDARDTLTLHNLRLVYTIAGRHTGRGVPLADLIQEGTLGLIRAAEKFEYAKGYRFSTYCFNWISQSVRRAVGDTGALIRYPTHVREQVNKLYVTREKLMQDTGRAPSDALLAETTGLSTEKTRSLRQLRNFSTSLDTPLYDDGETTLEEQLPAREEYNSNRLAEQQSLHRSLVREISRLDDNEQRIVMARWGLHDGPPLSRAELADMLSVSREWIRQLEVSALEKLSHNDMVRAMFADHADAGGDAA